MMSQQTLQPDYQLLEDLEVSGPFQTASCFQCRKCTNGCPVAFAMDIYPDVVIRMVLLGQREAVLHCSTIWVCAACETCSTRCPNEVKIAELMDGLKEMAVNEGLPCPQPGILNLHESFLKNIKKRGRLFESTFLPSYILRSGRLGRNWKTGKWLDELKLGWRMLYKRRFSVFPKTVKSKKEIRAILSQPQKAKKTT